MHVCDVTMLYAAESGGIRRYINAKRAWLRRQPGCLHTLMIPAARSMPEEPWTIALRSVPLPLSHGYRVPLGKSAAAQKLRELYPGLIEAADPYHLAWAVLEAGADLRIPTVAFCHSDLPQLLGQRYGARAERLAQRYLRRLYAQFDLVLAPSETMAAKLRDLGIAQVERQRLGVDVKTFRPGRRDPGLRARLGVDERSRLLIYTGRFAPEKNLDAMCRALRLLGEGYTLLLVGGGSLPRDLPHNVRVLRFIRESRQLAALLAQCDAFVHAGDQETFGLAVLEAMACGLPVVAVRGGAMHELVNEETGVLGASARAVTLAEGIAALFERDLARCGVRARAVAMYYDWESVLPELMQRYRRLHPGLHAQAAGAA